MALFNDFSKLRPNLAVSSKDTMVWAGAEEQYYDLGRRALDLVKFAGQLCEKPHFNSILDFPCGYGRVLRWLRAEYDYAAITACDLDRDGVAFCRDQFRATGVCSDTDLTKVTFPSQFDLIWCGSLLTHLPLTSWPKTIDFLSRWVQDCGVIVFSTQGRLLSTLLARGEGDFAENVDVAALLKSFGRDGAGFEAYFEDPKGEYGLTLTAPSYVARLIERRPDMLLRAYLEQAWGVQDVAILYKKAGHYAEI